MKNIIVFSRKKASYFLQTVKRVPLLLILGIEIGIGVIISLFTSFLFFKMTDLVLDKDGFGFDTQISMFLYNMRTPLLTSIMKFISFIGMDGIIFFSIIIPIFFYLKRRKHEAVLFTIMIVMGSLIDFLLKLVTQRPRPTFAPLVIENSFSFPSGHSMNSFIFFTTVAYFVYHFTHKKKTSLLAFVASAIIILSVGISRIYLGVHYPSDVLGGYLAGLLWMVSFIVIDKTLIFFRLFKQSNK
jgi:undecaprenyl-diphosphatase